MEYKNVDKQKNKVSTNIISEVVKRGYQADFEKWSKGINKVVSEQPGFLGLDILRPRDPSHLEYIIVVKFEDSETLNDWLTSNTFKGIFEKAKPFIVSHRSQQQSHGIEQWFELPSHAVNKKPAFYKLVILGVLGVYPLVLLGNLVLSPITDEMPYPLAILVSVLFISVFLTYPVMPFISKLLHGWLYPEQVA